ncbi:MAG: glycosyl transferase group 1 [Chthonomonadales bacterium]|nr:glycosyl transferase group 1 [Chthonomonadales bacterium]
MSETSFISDSPTSSEHAQKPDRLRVAYLTESYEMGGVERSTALLIQHLDRTQFDPILICSDDPAVSPMVEGVEANGALAVRTSLLSLFQGHSTRARLRGLRQLFLELKIDILHMQILGGNAGRICVLAARLAKIPIVIITVRGTAQGADSPLRRQVNRLFDRMVNRYTTASEQNRQSQISDIGRDPNRVRTIYNAIDVLPYRETIPTAAARAHLSLPTSGPVIGTIGRLDTQKGIEYFLAMAANLHNRVPEAHFLIVGDGAKRAEYEELTRQYQLEACVTFTGYRTDIPHCIAAMDVFVLASVLEPFGLVLAEAMMMERPVVATRIGGIPEVVEDGVTGALVPAYDGDALAEKVFHYLQNPDLAAAHGKTGRAHVLKRFSIERLMQEIHALYREECELAGLMPAKDRQN